MVPVHMSQLLKLTSDFAFSSGEQLGGPPPLHRWVCGRPFSELREPIWIIFGFLKSREVVAIDLLLFMGFVTAWSLDPEQFRKTDRKNARKKLFSEHFFVVVFWSDFYKK